MTLPTATIASPYLGSIDWDPDCEIALPAGLPGFERHHRLIPVEIPAQRPLVYLQSADNPEVCFLSLPVLAIQPEYQLHLSEDDLLALDLDAENAPVIGSDVICLALLIPQDGTVHANLDAPIVVNLHNNRGAQTVAASRCAGTRRLNSVGVWEAVC